MKPTGKLNPIIDKQQPIISELRTVNKLLEEIKSMLNEANQGSSNDSLTKGLERLVEEAAKQKKIMNRVRLAIETKNQSAENSIIGEKQVSDREKTEGSGLNGEKNRTKTDEIKGLVQEQNKLLRKQNEILATTSEYLGSMGNVISNIQTKLTTPTIDSYSHHTTTKGTTTSHIDVIFKQMQANLKKNPKDNQAIQKWVGQLIRIAAQDAFLSYCNKIQEDDVRMLFSSFVLSNYRKYILKLSKIDKVNIEFVEKIFYDSCKKTLEYLKFKFPQAKKKISDMSLSEKIQSTGKKVEPESDIIRNGKIELNFSKVSDLRSSVKTLINTLIIHGNEKYQTFKTRMLDLFVPVQKQDKQHSFYFLIGRKIKQSTPIYNENQLLSPGNFVKGNEILRILMKWIQELMEYFTSPDKIKNNKTGFKTTDNEIKKLGIKDRDKLWSKFEAMNLELKKDLRAVEDELRKTVTNILLMSENEIGSKFGKEVDFLDKEETSLLIICQYIYKALESYVMDVIVAILNRFNAIKQSFVDAGEEEADLELFTLTIGDLFRCKCSGTKEQILQVYENLTRQDKSGKFYKILRVKNRLTEGTQDILINFTLPEPESFFICQMQLALSTAREEINDHFNHFLYEQHRSPHGVITELGIMLFNLDPRRLYLNKHKLVFVNKTPKFQFIKTNTKSELVCISHPEVELNKKEKIKYYVCNNCGRFIDAYRFYFDALECPTCFNNVCPICQFQILPEEEVVKRMFEFAPKLEGYFTMVGKPFLNQQMSIIKEQIYELLKTNKYLGVLALKNNKDDFELKVIKMFRTEVVLQSDDEDSDEDQEQQESPENLADKSILSPKRQQSLNSKPQPSDKLLPEKPKKAPQKKKIVEYILTSFTNLQFNFEDLDDSIVFLLKPANLSDLLFSTYCDTSDLHQDIYDLQWNFDDEEPDSENLYMIENGVTGKKFVVDYNVKDEKELVSKAKIERVIKNVEEGGVRGIVLDDFILENLEGLGEIKRKELVTEIELSRGVTYEEHEEAMEYETGREEGGEGKGKEGEGNKEEKEEKADDQNQDEGEDQDEDQGQGQDGQEGQDQDEGQNQVTKKQKKQTPKNKNQTSPPQHQQSLSSQQSPNNITQLHTLNSFPNITILSLYSIQSFSNFTNFSFASKLTEIVIKNCSIESFDFTLIPSIKTIDFSNNCLSTLPTVTLPLLETLTLTNNWLESVSSLSASTLPKLSKLLLGNNYIAGDFPQLSFPQLRVLDASSNQLTTLTSLQHSALPKLKNLLLSQNQIPSLPNISNLKQLTKIALSQNLISVVELLSHDKLETLDLNTNQVKNIGKLEMKCLRELDLGENKIEDEGVVAGVLGGMEGGWVNLVFNEFGKLPLGKMKVGEVYVERGKVGFEIGNIWDEGEGREVGVCRRCKRGIVTVGVWVERESQEYYCRGCGEGMKDRGREVVLVVEITGDDMNRKA